ncbi:MAG TPA: FAD-binding oxidoreductase [Candidatus Dormibacteraeota bacterium]|nr:FAD-binding oxidoreductase [Candidatus Dormibacteraeota bacterium]
MTIATRSIDELLEDLRGRLAGRIIEPGDADYEAARTVMYGGIDRHPRAIVRVASDADVQAVVNLAREANIELAVRGGGHSVKGDCSTEGGIGLDLHDRKRIDLDPTAKTVWAETGLTAEELCTAVAEHGFVLGFGDTGSVGIGGITLGGGVGYLVRKLGLTIDSLLAADVVTADGQLHRIDPDHEPDLFWAIRGGGGNFGVATRFQYRLAVVPSVVGGMLVLPATAETVERYMALSEAAPEELSSIANVMPCPPFPFADEHWHGKIVIFAFMCFAGDVAAGAAALAPFRDVAQLGGLDAPIVDQVHPIAYPEMYAPEDPDYHPTAVALNLFLDRFDRAIAEAIMDRLERSDASVRVAQLRVLGGAAARVPIDATAYAHRDRAIMVNIASFYEGEEDRARRLAWVEELTGAIRRSGDEAAYVNFIADEGPARVRAAYPHGAYERLAEIKRRYDPTNLFRLNQNIPPA